MAATELIDTSRPKTKQVTDALRMALDLSRKFDDNTLLALEILRASVEGIITSWMLDAQVGQMLCATIRADSKYRDQLDFLPTDRQIFPVSVRSEGDGYCIVGGPGGNYRLSDVHLYAVDKCELVRLT